MVMGSRTLPCGEERAEVRASSGPQVYGVILYPKRKQFCLGNSRKNLFALENKTKQNLSEFSRSLGICPGRAIHLPAGSSYLESGLGVVSFPKGQISLPCLGNQEHSCVGSISGE